MSTTLQASQLLYTLDMQPLYYIKVRKNNGKTIYNVIYPRFDTLIKWYEFKIIISGDLMDEAAVLEWLIQNRSTGDEDDVIEDVDAKSLDTMIQSIEHLAVLFCKI